MNELKFLQYANEATAEIRKITQSLTGTTDLDGGLLWDIYCCVFDMVQEYFAPTIGKCLEHENFINMITEILFAEKNEIDGIVKRYCESYSKE